MSFIDFWTHADFLSKSLSFVLLIMSIATWTIVILRVLATRQATASSAKELNQSIAELAIRSAKFID